MGNFLCFVFFSLFFPDRGYTAWQWKSTETSMCFFILCPALLTDSGTYKATLLEQTIERNPIARSEMNIFLDL